LNRPGHGKACRENIFVTEIELCYSSTTVNI
jgi:hypothetical protein